MGGGGLYKIFIKGYNKMTWNELYNLESYKDVNYNQAYRYIEKHFANNYGAIEYLQDKSIADKNFRDHLKSLIEKNEIDILRNIVMAAESDNAHSIVSYVRGLLNGVMCKTLETLMIEDFKKLQNGISMRDDNADYQTHIAICELCSKSKWGNTNYKIVDPRLLKLYPIVFNTAIQLNIWGDSRELLFTKKVTDINELKEIEININSIKSIYNNIHLPEFLKNPNKDISFDDCYRDGKKDKRFITEFITNI